MPVVAVVVAVVVRVVMLAGVGVGVRSGVWVGVLDAAVAVALAAELFVGRHRGLGHGDEVSCERRVPTSRQATAAHGLRLGPAPSLLRLTFVRTHI